MSVLQKYLDMLARASVKHRSIGCENNCRYSGRFNIFRSRPICSVLRCQRGTDVCAGKWMENIADHFFARSHLFRTADPGVVHVNPGENR